MNGCWGRVPAYFGTWLVTMPLLAGCETLNTPLPEPDQLEPRTAPATRPPTTVIEVSEEVSEVIADEPAPPPVDLLDRIRDGFALPDSEAHADRIAPHLRWYASHPQYLDRVFARASRYMYFIVEQLDEREMPLEFALLPIVESAYDPFAYSHGRAAGLWQIIPGTGKRLGLKQDWWYDGRRDVVAATGAALDYLEAMHERFDDDWLLTTAAYNSGPGRVGRSRNGSLTGFWELKLPAETRNYVPKLLALKMLVSDPERYGVTLPVIANDPVFASVDTGGQIDLATAADLADTDLDTLYLLNPGFNRWATDPDGPHQLLVPFDKAELFAESLAALPPEDRLRWVRYRIRPGDSLILIARKHNTTVEVVRQINGIRGSMIRAGDHLMIPVASKSLDEYALSAGVRLQRTQNTPRGANRTSHVVERGDSLWKIASSFHVDAGRLAKWNGMAPGDTLRVGQELVVWTEGARRSGPPQTRRKIHYTVRRGDSLARISSKFNVTVAQLRAWNAKARGKYIQPGQKLVVYVDVRQQGG